MLDPDVSFIAGAKELAVALDKLTIDGRPVWRLISALPPHPFSSGGRNIPITVALDPPKIVVVFNDGAVIQRITCYIEGDLKPSDAFNLVQVWLKQRKKAA